MSERTCGECGGEMVAIEDAEGPVVACSVCGVSGEIVPEGVEEASLIADYELRSGSAGPIEEWLPDWYLGKVAHAKALRMAISEQAARLFAAVESMEKALGRRWGEKFKAIVDAKLVGSGKKSIDFGVGRAGYRMSPAALDVFDEEKAVRWLAGAAPEAIRKEVRKREALKVLAALPKGEQAEGMEIREPVNKFFPAIPGPVALPPPVRGGVTIEPGNPAEVGHERADRGRGRGEEIERAVHDEGVGAGHGSSAGVGAVDDAGWN